MDKVLTIFSTVQHSLFIAFAPLRHLDYRPFKPQFEMHTPGKEICTYKTFSKITNARSAL